MADPERTWRLVEDADDWAAVVGALAGEPRYAVDTEFHRERTYAPRLALVQLAWPGDCVLVDPLAVDLAPLAAVLDGPGIAVLHAAAQDLEVLQNACGTVPATIFDTQVAAGFLGFSSPSLGTLAERVLGVYLPKGDRMTDWLKRPLRRQQLDYAAGDVTSLLAIADAVEAELEATGRRAWVTEELVLLRDRSVAGTDPDSAWLKLKDARGLRGRSRAVAVTVAAWRERRAVERDIPVRFVLPDLAVIGIAGAAPTTAGQLRAVRGLDDRHLRGGATEGLLAAVQQGLDLPPERIPSPRRDDVDRALRPAIGLVSAWVGQLGRELRIDPALLATRADLVALLNGEPGARLSTGWRADLVGGPVRRLVDGEAALAFARPDHGRSRSQGYLVLEERSGRAVTVDLPIPRAPWVEDTTGVAPPEGGADDKVSAELDIASPGSPT